MFWPVRKIFFLNNIRIRICYYLYWLITSPCTLINQSDKVPDVLFCSRKYTDSKSPRYSATKQLRRPHLTTLVWLCIRNVLMYKMRKLLAKVTFAFFFTLYTWALSHFCTFAFKRKACGHLLFVIIELFSLSVMVETLWGEIRRFSKGVGHFQCKFQMEGGVTHQPLLVPEN